MNALSTYLANEYGVECVAGGKTTCPKCQHNSFSLKRDGSVAKCFYPGCLWVITPRCIEQRPSLHKLLSQLLHQWHKHLLEPGDLHQKAAIKYLTKDRGISQVIGKAAAIGLVPEKPDIESDLKNLVNELRASAEPKQGRKKKSEFDPQEYADWLEEQGNDLISKASKLRGWLAFFYQNGKGRWCAIHFRKPGTKMFSTFKPKSMGLFGRDIFIPNRSKALTGLNDYGIIVEGEFDCLKMQSVIAEVELDPALIVATGGTSLVDTEAIAALIPKTIICKDNDNAGSGMVEIISRKMHCEVCAPPQGFNDIDEYLCSFKGQPQLAYDALKAIVEMRTPKYQLFETVREYIDGIRRGNAPSGAYGDNQRASKLRSFEIEKLVSQTLIKDMSVRGKFFREGEQGFYLDRQTKKLLRLEPDGLGISMFLSQYGLNSTEKIFKYAVEALIIHALGKGDNVSVRHFSHFQFYDGEPVLYIASSDNSILRVTWDAVEVVDNGSDGVIFLSSESHAPPDILLRSQAAESNLLDRLILHRIPFLPGKLSCSESQFLLKCWIMAFLFRSLLPCMPLLTLIGPKGSGKTTALRLIGKLLCGDSWKVIPIGDSEGDFDTLITSKHLVGLDNVDAHKKWLNDKLAVVATGGTIQKRELYTTNRSREFPIIATLAITSRTPSFRRDDVAERLLILETARIDEQNQIDFQSELDIINEVIPRRAEIWAELIQLTQGILKVIKETDLTQVRIPSARMQDFARFTVVMGKALGCEAKARGIWDKLIAVQDEFTLEGDSLCEILMHWAQSNAGREVIAGELNNELRVIADDRGLKWNYKSGRSLAQKLRHIKSNLRHLLRIDERKGPQKQNIYAFYPIEEQTSTPDSGVIPDVIPDSVSSLASGIESKSRNHRNQFGENQEKKRINEENKYITCDDSLPVSPGLHKSGQSNQIEKHPDVSKDKANETVDVPAYVHRNRDGISPQLNPENLPQRYQHLFFERAGIREFDGGLNREDAGRAAWEDVQRLIQAKFLN